MMEEKKEIGYKIMASKDYMVFRNEYNGKIFYKIAVKRKNADDTEEVAYKAVRFKRGIELQDRTIIRPIAGFEDFYMKDKYTPIFSLVITEFEKVENKQQSVDNAYKDFQNNLVENEKENDGIEGIEITDDDLPF